MTAKLRIALVYGYNSSIEKCGVGDYVENLLRHIKINNVKSINVRPKNIFGWIRLIFVLRKFSVIHVQYPLESWGASIFPGLIPAFLSIFSSGVEVIYTFHEWKRMNWIRRISVWPAAVLSHKLIFVSKIELESYSSSIISRFARRQQKSAVIPIGSNIDTVFVNFNDVVSFRQKVLPGPGLLLGFFGFIYDAKQPFKMIQVAANICQILPDSKLLVCGWFPPGHDQQRVAFLKEIENRNLSDSIILMGYVEDESLLALYLSACDWNIQLYDDGLTSRRGSFWFVRNLGVPVVSTFPVDAFEFSCVGEYEPTMDEDVILVDVNASPEFIVNSIFNSSRVWRFPEQKYVSQKWSDIGVLHEEFYQA